MQVFSFLSHLQRFTKREYVLISRYYWGIIQVGGAIFLVHGSIILTNGATLLVNGSIFLTGQVHISSEREHIPNRTILTFFVITDEKWSQE